MESKDVKKKQTKTRKVAKHLIVTGSCKIWDSQSQGCKNTSTEMEVTWRGGGWSRQGDKRQNVWNDFYLVWSSCLPNVFCWSQSMNKEFVARPGLVVVRIAWLSSAITNGKLGGGAIIYRPGNYTAHLGPHRKLVGVGEGRRKRRWEGKK